MKIGITLLAGNMQKYGYQYTHQEVLKNFAHFADQVVMLSSSRHNSMELTKPYKNILHISDASTWFEEKDGEEVFSYDVLVRNINTGLEKLKELKCDVALQIHINQYVSEECAVNLRKVIKNLLESGEPYTWLYKKYQLGDWMFHADTRLPWIINLQIDNPYVFRPDSIMHRETEHIIRIESGDFREHDREAISDLALTYTIQDAEELFYFTQKENLKLSGQDAGKAITFNPESWKNYHLTKLSAKVRSQETPGSTGKKIIEAAGSDFLFHEFQRRFKPINNSLPAKALRFLKAKLPLK